MKKKTFSIPDAILPRDFILGTKVQPNKAHFMNQITVTLTSKGSNYHTYFNSFL